MDCAVGAERESDPVVLQNAMPDKKQPHQEQKPFCLVSYSSREPQIHTLLPCLWIAFAPHFNLQVTPSLKWSRPAHSNHQDDSRLFIRGCGPRRPSSQRGLRVGLLEACKKPIILLKEKNATVDVQSLVGTVNVGVTSPVLDINSHFSNVKGINHAEWNKVDCESTIRIILQEYKKKKAKIKRYVEIKEPSLWSS